MAIKMVRQPSEEPNIKNVDDFIPFRYAYGNQNGYVIGKGSELSYSVNGSDFIVNSGRVVIQGVETDIDANGFVFTIDNNATTRYYVVYNEVNLATNESTLKLVYDTATYPIIESGDDLNEFTTGIARTSLYKFSAVNGVISNVEKIVKPIKYTKDVEVNSSKNVSESINGKQLSDIFETDGTTIKTSTRAKITSFTVNDFIEHDLKNKLEGWNLYISAFLTDLKLEIFTTNVGSIYYTQKPNTIIHLGTIPIRATSNLGYDSVYLTFSGIFTNSYTNKDYVLDCLLEYQGGYFNVYRISGGGIEMPEGNEDVGFGYGVVAQIKEGKLHYKEIN